MDDSNITNVTPLQKVQDLAVKNSNLGGSIDTSDVGLTEIFELEDIVKKADMPPQLKDKSLKMIGRLKRMAQFGSYSGEFEVVEKYIEWISSIPWGKYSKDNLDLANVKRVLDENHYGIQVIKDRILEYLAVMNLLENKEQGQIDLNNQSKTISSGEMSRLQGSSSHAPIICFVGLQGIGKTSMAKSIAEALGRRLVRISLGAVGSVYELRGRSRAFLDAEPGQIIKALVRSKVSNPLILLDEIDKVSGQSGLRMDVMASLLEILDPEQNSTFIDHYVDYPIDLSQVMFIATANNLGGMSTALLDRLEIVRFSSYTDEEKKRIAIDYLLPKIYEATGLRMAELQFDDAVWQLIIRPYGFDAGVRQLERNLTNIARKVAKEIVEGSEKRVLITPENIRRYLPDDIGVLS